MAEEKMKGEEEKMKPCAEMAESLNGESANAALDLKSESSNPNDRSVCTSSVNKTNAAVSKVKSCKGWLYYSSNLQANSRNPLCVGISRSLPKEPQNVAEASKINTHDEGKSLIDFKYGCVGYSVYKDQKGQTSHGQQGQRELPFCVGLELLVDRRAKAADSASVPSHVLNREDGNKSPQPQPQPRPQPQPQHRSPKPTNATEEDFLNRFARNANVVANGVAKNMRRVGNQIKRSLNDVLFPYRRPPK